MLFIFQGGPVYGDRLLPGRSPSIFDQLIDSKQNILSNRLIVFNLLSFSMPPIIINLLIFFQ